MSEVVHGGDASGSRRLISLIGVGLVAGFLSGLFGVGGGILIVPALVFLIGMTQKISAGTSLAAIVPTSIVGVLSYLVNDSVNWLMAILLAIGSVIGAQIGTYLLDKINRRALQWIFIAFLVVVIVQLFLVVPARGDTVEIGVGTGAGLLLLGLLTGVLSGLIGIGGGIVIVPMLVMLFGASDLVAKGTSLAMMIPTAISGTIGNIRRHNVDLKAAAIIGIAAAITASGGAVVAALVSPQLGNLLFAIFLIAIVLKMVWEARRPASR